MYVWSFRNTRTGEVLSFKDTPGKLAWQHLDDARRNGIRRGVIWQRLKHVPVTFGSDAVAVVPGLALMKAV
jgi:hypothetical protein